MERLHDVFVAELLEDQVEKDPDLKLAVKVDSASFTWDSPPPEPEDQKKKKKVKRVPKNSDGDQEKTKEDKVFSLKDINLEIPRGSLVAIVGKSFSYSKLSFICKFIVMNHEQ